MNVKCWRRVEMGREVEDLLNNTFLSYLKSLHFAHEIKEVIFLDFTFFDLFDIQTYSDKFVTKI